MRHGGSHASGVCLSGNLQTEYIVFVWSLVYDFSRPLLIRDSGLNLGNAIM